jgi:hypothetical protein
MRTQGWVLTQILTRLLYASRFVTHCDVSREDIDTFVDAVGVYFAQRRRVTGPMTETITPKSLESRLTVTS